ncbi:MAG: hypothetical protein AVDCRST_MAG14-1001 [uncultured Rubrobacteraceae bacterium]|uniref:Uncharacterized protein n=1 Tax=uncultured Rubrobacteraceae bacterium TaxID=349277 RepID=A0A6J4QRM5_9ACTN|nr:MAG: hypothetical protein AVDCRST_MAG14-1001 [uncultured Rubrobacteraceae bacterium]
MADPHGGSAQAGIVFVATFFFVLVAAVISTGLVVYTA